LTEFYGPVGEIYLLYKRRGV